MFIFNKKLFFQILFDSKNVHRYLTFTLTNLAKHAFHCTSLPDMCCVLESVRLSVIILEPGPCGEEQTFRQVPGLLERMLNSQAAWPCPGTPGGVWSLSWCDCQVLILNFGAFSTVSLHYPVSFVPISVIIFSVEP